MATIIDHRDRVSTGERRRSHLLVDDGPDHWILVASDAREGARARRDFRAYLEQHGDPEGDFHAAEMVFGELVNSCVDHAPGPIRIEFRWSDATLVVVDSCERLRHWPFSAEDMRSESTHHAHRVIAALAERVHLSRDPSGGTRASVVLPVRKREA